MVCFWRWLSLNGLKKCSTIIKYCWMRHWIWKHHSEQMEQIEKTYNSSIVPCISCHWYKMINTLYCIYWSISFQRNIDHITYIVSAVFCFMPAWYFSIISRKKNNPKVWVSNFLNHENKSCCFKHNTNIIGVKSFHLQIQIELHILTYLSWHRLSHPVVWKYHVFLLQFATQVEQHTWENWYLGIFLNQD